MMPREPGPVAERGFRLLVSCYPPSIRAAFGPDIAITFRDAYRDRVRGPLSSLRFWARALWEGLATIPTAWFEWWTGAERGTPWGAAGGRARVEGRATSGAGAML